MLGVGSGLYYNLDGGLGGGDLIFQRGFGGQFLGLDLRYELGLRLSILERLFRSLVTDGFGILVLMFAGNGDRGEKTTAHGCGHHLLGQFFYYRLLVRSCRRVTAQSRWILASLRSQQHVHHGPDEHEHRGEYVHPDTRDMRRGVVTHQFDPEPPDAIGRHVEGEQPAVTQPVLAVGIQQEREHQQVPQQFIEEGWVYDSRNLPCRDTIERVDVNHTGGIAAIEDLHAPGHGGLPAVQLLVEVVAEAADRLRQNNPRGDRIAESRQRNSPAAAGNPRPDTAESDSTPDAQAALPDLQCRANSGTTLTEIGPPVGEQVIDPPADQPERHRPQRDVVDDPAFPAAGSPASIADHQRGNDAGDDAERVGPNRNRP